MAFTIYPTPIREVGTNNNSDPRQLRIKEDDGETFKIGVPVDLVAGTAGYVAEWGGSDITPPGSLIGISAEPGSNLTTDGVPKTLTFGSVQHQASAVNIPRGAPLNDGKCGVYVGTNTIFTARLGTTDVDATPAQADIGKLYGLTKHTASGFWYVDKGKTTLGTDTVVQVVKLDPTDAYKVHFVFLDSVLSVV